MKNKLDIFLLILALTIMVLFNGCSMTSIDLLSASVLEEKDSLDISKRTPIRIATLSDTECGNLGQIVALALEYEGFEIEDANQSLGSTTLLRETYQQKLADITIEYTGNAMYQMKSEGNPIWQDYESAYVTARDYFKSNYDIDMLRPVKARNSELFAVTRDFAEENNIKDMWDLADYINNGGIIKLSTYNYWIKHEQGLPAFEKTYGFTIPKANIVTRDINIEDLVEAKDGLNCAIVFNSDGIIEELDLYIIDDPEEVSPVYAPAPLVDSELLVKHPEIEEILTPIFQSIELEDLIKMNNKQQSYGLSSKQIAYEFLVEKGFI